MVDGQSVKQFLLLSEGVFLTQNNLVDGVDDDVFQCLAVKALPKI